MTFGRSRVRWSDGIEEKSGCPHSSVAQAKHGAEFAKCSHSRPSPPPMNGSALRLSSNTELASWRVWCLPEMRINDGNGFPLTHSETRCID